MKSLARKIELTLEVPKEKKIRFPSFYVSNDQLPEIDKWKVGEEYLLKVMIKMSDYNQHFDIDGKESTATLEVLSYEIPAE